MEGETAYDSILSFSNTKQFAEYRRTLVGSHGGVGSGRMATAMKLVFSREAGLPAQAPADASASREPTELILDYGNSRKFPGLIFNKASYSEILHQISARQEVQLSSLLDSFLFSKSDDENRWQQLTARVKTRLVARNLDKLNKETNTNYRIYGERLHYLTLGRLVTKDEAGVEANYPLVLFSCSRVDEQKLIVKVDSSGFLNFWLDKNILHDVIAKKHHDNFEVELSPDFSTRLNSLATDINSMNFVEYQDVKIDPTFLALQIVTGFEAEYIDPAWEKILEGATHV